MASSTSDIKAPLPTELPLGPSKKKIHAFDCAICCGSLTKAGPPLECFTFGKLLLNFSELSFLERELIYRDFSSVGQCFTNGRFDCDKIVTTICGHLFHSCCIREWFFMRRLDRHPKCPFCNQVTGYDECLVVHPMALDEEDDADNMTCECHKTCHDTEYSDISCASSSWPSDEEGSTVSEMDDVVSEDEGTVLAARGNNEFTAEPQWEMNEVQVVGEIQMVSEDEETMLAGQGNNEFTAEPQWEMNEVQGVGEIQMVSEDEGTMLAGQGNNESTAEPQLEMNEVQGVGEIQMISEDEGIMLAAQENNESTAEPQWEKYGVYLPPSSTSKDSSDSKEIFVEKPDSSFSICDCMHLVTLLWLIFSACQRYHVKKEKFEAEMDTLMDNVDDECLECIESQKLVPFGYDLIFLGVVAGVAIYIWESFLDTLKRKQRN